MIEWRYHYDTKSLLNYKDPETQSFFGYYLSYLSQLRTDDFSQWTPEDFKFYNQVNFEIALDGMQAR